MRRRVRQPVAATLAGVAAFALVLAPVLHSEVHVREVRQAEGAKSADFDRVFALVFAGRRGPAERAELSRALARVLDGTEPGAPHLHGPGEAPHAPSAPGHSHGGSGPHGIGSLQHFAAAIHAAPALPALAQARDLSERVPERPAPVFISRSAYLVEQSQGPPRA